jgi:ABC-type nitrate/sulfonate/bicarbonate transport system substrate-binding protein
MINRREAAVLILAGLAGACSKATPGATNEALNRPINVGHLVGVCMAPLFYAHAQGMFKSEGLDVRLKWMPNPGDAITGLVSGALDFVHNPFTNTFVACDGGAKLKIIGGSGNEGLSCVASERSGIKTLDDLKARAGKGLKVGSQRINTLELTFYRTIRNLGLTYKDFDMVWFHDHFAMLAAFQSGQVDVVTHVEPFVSRMVLAGAVEVSNSRGAWGVTSPDCVISASDKFLAANPAVVERYLRAALKADREIKADMARAVDVLDRGRYYKVPKDVLAHALPNQPPGIDMRNSVSGMNLAIKDMLELGYIRREPQGVVDLSYLEKVF